METVNCCATHPIILAVNLATLMRTSSSVLGTIMSSQAANIADGVESTLLGNQACLFMCNMSFFTAGVLVISSFCVQVVNSNMLT